MSNVSNNTLELKKYMYHMNKEKKSIKILLNIPMYHSINKINIHMKKIEYHTYIFTMIKTSCSLLCI